MPGRPETSLCWGMVIDLDKCTGCGTCATACQVENNLAPQAEATDKARCITWLRLYRLDNGKAFPDSDSVCLPLSCQHCRNPLCVPVCPVTATQKQSPGGIVAQVHARCIGCRYCMIACPYHARYFNWRDPHWPPGAEKSLSPFVSTRPRGVAEKCTFCAHRWQLAKNQALAENRDPYRLRENEYIPACAEACPTKAICFGDLNNPAHQVHRLSRLPGAFQLLPSAGAEPQVWYLSRRDWVRKLSDRALNKENRKK